MNFLVASGLPFKMLIGCDMLKKYSAIIDMNKSKLFLKVEHREWTANLVDSDRTTSTRITYHIQGSVEQLGQLQDNEIRYELDNEQLWRDKINEIRTFKCDISDVQKEN